jgi:hypothetical protein
MNFSTWRRLAYVAPAFFTFALIHTTADAERINQEGRLLGPAPIVAVPTLFNTPEADAIVSAMQIMPVDSAWNEDISRRPLLANSAAMIAQIKSDLSSTRQTLRPFYEMNYVLVPDTQPRVTIPFFNYPDESDLDGGAFPNGRYPIPPNLPVEEWPRNTGNLTLQQWQQDVNNDGGDRHAIIVAPGAGSTWETWLTKLTQSGWQASNGAKFDLNSNAMRPLGWTSADAAGLPMFPALVRYDECERGMVEHALRLVVANTRREYIYPASHYASSIPASSNNYPAMGQRLRLKSTFIIPDTWTIEEKAVLRALRKYGAFVADNGGFFSVSVCPDDRFPANAFDHLSTIDINNFEVIQTTGPMEGPRSPGAPRVDAGPDVVVGVDDVTALNAAISGLSTSASITWRLYSGPAPVQFSDPNNARTTASFTTPGRYTLMVAVADGVHPVAYDAVVLTVMPRVRLANISTRAVVGTGENVTIAGFIIGGTASKQVMVRALGPSLSSLGVPNVLVDPMLDLRDGSGNPIATNDNWKDLQEQIIRNTGLAPQSDAESAVVGTLAPGSYTAIMSGKNNTTGIGLVEVYELNTDGTARLLNISTRGFVGTGDNVMIAGIILSGTDRGTICFRALGPSLGTAGVQNPIYDPQLELFDAQGTKIGSNNNWKDSQQNAIQLAGLSPGNDAESALLIDLPPGTVTAILSDANGGMGVALIEAYHLP